MKTTNRYYHYCVETNEPIPIKRHIDGVERGIIIGNIHENTELLKQGKKVARKAGMAKICTCVT